MVGLAARTGALVIGEGVEHPEQLQLLASLGVAAAQGYLLGRPGPLPAATAVELPAPSLQLRAAPHLGPAPVDRPPPATAAWRQSIGAAHLGEQQAPEQLRGALDERRVVRLPLPRREPDDARLGAEPGHLALAY